MKKFPVHFRESLTKMAYAASATISGFREYLPESLPVSISMAAVWMAKKEETLR